MGFHTYSFFFLVLYFVSIMVQISENQKSRLFSALFSFQIWCKFLLEINNVSIYISIWLDPCLHYFLTFDFFWFSGSPSPLPDDAPLSVSQPKRHSGPRFCLFSSSSSWALPVIPFLSCLNPLFVSSRCCLQLGPRNESQHNLFFFTCVWVFVCLHLSRTRIRC